MVDRLDVVVGRRAAGLQQVLDQIDAAARAVALVAARRHRSGRSRCRSRNARRSAGSSPAPRVCGSASCSAVKWVCMHRLVRYPRTCGRGLNRPVRGSKARLHAAASAARAPPMRRRRHSTRCAAQCSSSARDQRRVAARSARAERGAHGGGAPPRVGSVGEPDQAAAAIEQCEAARRSQAAREARPARRGLDADAPDRALARLGEEFDVADRAPQPAANPRRSAHAWRRIRRAAPCSRSVR